MEITLTRGRQDNQIVFAPRGDLDLYSSVEFFKTVQNRFDQTTNRLVLDLAEVRYLDSSGVGALIRLAQHAKSIAGEIRLVNLAGTPKKVLEMSNVVRLFKVDADVNAALKAWE